MSLRLYQRDRGKIWWMRGTTAGRRFNRSTRQTEKKEADQVRVAFEGKALKRDLVGVEETLTFAEAVTLYLDDGRSHRFIDKLLEYFKKTPGVPPVSPDTPAIGPELG